MDGSSTAVEITLLVVSAVHAFEGRPDDGPLADPGPVTRTSVEVRAGLGLDGDRYCGRPAHRRAAVTLFAQESLDAVAGELGTGPLDPVLTRRNVVLRGADVDALAAPARGGTGAVFALDSGDGPVRFRAHRAAHPCRWMDVVLAPGAFRALRGRGGIRCAPLDDGVLRLGPAVLRVLEPIVYPGDQRSEIGNTRHVPALRNTPARRSSARLPCTSAE